MVSVIVPVFNVAVFLDNCLESIAAQTLSDFECILVDDGSTDGSGALCDKMAEKDKRFKVIHQTNRGVSAARNQGLNAVSGDYVSFIDSDDIVHPEYLGTLLKALTGDDAEIAVCGMSIKGLDGTSAVLAPSRKAVFPIDISSIRVFLELERKNLLWGPCIKIYRQDLIERNGIRYDESLSYGEDLVFNLAYFSQVKNVATVPEALYLYRRRPETLSTRFRPDRFRTDYDQWKRILGFHAQKGLLCEDASVYLYSRLWGTVYDGIFQYPHLKKRSPGYLRRILSIPEIDRMGDYADSFPCQRWIKQWILKRRAGLFHLYFSLFYNR